MAKVRIGIIGCGGIAHQKHFPALGTMKDKVELAAFCDIIPERAEESAKNFGIPGAKVYTDYHELLKDESIDTVHVCTPNVAHASITIDAFKAGKNVYCEKPMSNDPAAAQKMIDAWKASGKKFTVGYQNRFRKDVQALHKSCEDGELGDIYFAKAHAIRRRAVPTWGVFPDKSKQGGGPLIDIGTHSLDMTLWCMDNYKPVSVMGSTFDKLGHLQQATEGNLFGPWDPKTYEVEDSAFGFIKMENGATIYLEASWALNVRESREASTTLCGTKAGAEDYHGMSYPNDELVYNRGHNGLLTEEKISAEGSIDFFEGDASGEAVADAQQWIDAVANDKEPLVKPEQALKVTQILDAIYKSSETGKPFYF
ncbi:Gfo/Idh/MocA family protein [Lacticaseibacillus sp. GG6-2]